MTSVFLFSERPSRSWRGSEAFWQGKSLIWLGPAHERYGKALEARRAREPIARMAQTRHMGCITKGRSYPMRRGFPPTITFPQEIRSIGHNSRKLLSNIYPTANRASTWNQVYLMFFVVVRFKCCVQMIRSTLSKFENGINTR